MPQVRYLHRRPKFKHPENMAVKTSGGIRPHLALLLCNTIWACDYPFYNLVLGKYVTPLAMVTASLVAAALLSLIPTLWEKREKVAASDIGIMFGAAVLMGIARKMLLMYGLSRTSPIDGSIIDTIVPLLVLLISVASGLDTLSRKKLFGLALGMAGAVAVVMSGGTGAHERSQLTGNVMIFLCACSTALYMVWFKKLVMKYRITTVLRWVYCLAAAMMLPLGAHDIATTDFAAMDGKIIFAALFVLLVPTYGPNLLLNYSLKFVAPTVSSIYTYIQPVLAIILSVAMGLDRLHWDTVVFAAVIFTGVALVIRSYNTPPAPKPTAHRGPAYK